VHASTSAPFADRQSSSVVAAALGLDTGIAALDVAQSQRAGTSALLLALASTQAAGTESLVVAAEHRRCKPGSARELLYGDGAAALTIGHDGVVAKVLGAASSTHDFVDHYRRALDGFDHDWEERWVRDEGYLKLVPPVVADALRAVPVKWKEGAIALGCDEWRMTRRVSIRAIRPALVAGTTLAMGRAVGEAIALSMATGSIAFIPNPLDGYFFFLEPVRTLASSIVDYSEGFESPELKANLFAFGVILLITTAALTIGAKIASRAAEKKLGGS